MFWRRLNFYPRSPCGERLVGTVLELQCILDFYPRSPCGERRLWVCLAGFGCLFLSTLSLRRATHYDNYNLHCVEISIHALLAESDYDHLDGILSRYIFLSTLSLRRATFSLNPPSVPSFDFYPRSPCGERPNGPAGLFARVADFYPRSPCGERPQMPTVSSETDPISIHALLAESDAATVPETLSEP